MVAAAIVGGAVIGAVASNSASSKQEDAAGAATDLQRDQNNQARADNEPWRQSGMNALAKLNELMNSGSLTSRFTGANVMNEPGYAFGMQQGMKAIDNSASARGGIGGAALMAGTRYAQDYAGTKYGAAFDRDRMEKADSFNRLAGMAGVGQQINAANSAAGQNFANNAGSNMLGASNAMAGNAMNQGNIWGNALNQYSAYGNRRGWGQTGGYDSGVGGLGSGGSPDGYW